jgi:hypothetical protein
MAKNQTRGNKMLREEVAFMKSLFNRFRNNREIQDLFEEETGKHISIAMIHHIRTGKRWVHVEPCPDKTWE